MSILHQPNKSDYRKKILDFLNDVDTYEPLKKDPTNLYKTKLVNILRDWKTNKSISDNLYHRLYPTSDLPPRFYGLPKIHKANIPLRPIVSSIGNITCSILRYLTQVLSPMVHPPHRQALINLEVFHPISLPVWQGNCCPCKADLYTTNKDIY